MLPKILRRYSDGNFNSKCNGDSGGNNINSNRVHSNSNNNSVYGK